MGHGAGPFFRGTDMFAEHLPYLRDYAEEVLQEGGNEFTLTENALVFSVHQGYSVLYMDLGRDRIDPPIWHYSDSKDAPAQISASFSDFFQKAVVEHKKIAKRNEHATP